MSNFLLTPNELNSIRSVFPHEHRALYNEFYELYFDIRDLTTRHGSQLSQAEYRLMIEMAPELSQIVYEYENGKIAKYYFPEKYLEARIEELYGDSFDSPCAVCKEEKICEEINPGDEIDPYSRAHMERNACNRCPEVHPDIIITKTITHTGGRTGTVEEEVLDYYLDSEGNQWIPDHPATAAIYHGDPYPPEPYTTLMNRTIRLEHAPRGGSGWQCRYVNGQLDDESKYMGTYDYASPNVDGVSTHRKMDVVTHEVNGFYVPNLTEIIK